MAEEKIEIRGLSQFFYAAIPWVIAVGLTALLTFFVTAWHIHSEIRQAERSAIYVGAKHLPTAKIKIEDASSSCIKLARADYDGGGSLVMYARNDCHKSIDYLAWTWQFVSAGNVVLAQSFTNGCPIPSEPGSQAECTVSPDDDDRATILRISLTPGGL